MVLNYCKDLILYSYFVKKPFLLILFFLFAVTTQVYSSKIKTAYEALSIYDYFKAKKIFYSLNKKKPNAQACYGLSIIYYRTNNPFHNYDSAAKYAALSFNCFNFKKDSCTLSSFPIYKKQIRIQIDSIALKLFTKAIAKNTINAYDQFLSQNYLASENIIQSAIKSRDELELQLIYNVNKSDSTLLFIQTHPLSKFKHDAFRLYEKELYEEITADHSELSYITFINTQQKNSNLNQAYQALLTLYKDAKNKEGVAQFIKNYPKAPQRIDAWQALFNLSITTFKKEELEQFITTYPEFPFKESILKEVQLNDLVLIPFEKNEAIGFIDTTGKIHIAPEYDEVSEFSEGLCIVHKSDSVYFVNKENKNTLNMIFSDALPFYNGLAPIKQASKWYLINRLGELKSEGFEEINDLNNELYVVKQNNLYGAIDPYGKVVYETKFDKLGDFKNNCAYYQLGANYGFINRSGYIHKAEFEWISDFGSNGLAIYKSQGKYGIIQQNGELLTKALYDQIIKATDRIFILIINNLYGYYAGEGCFLSDIAYDFDKEKPNSYYTNGNMLKLIKKNEQALMDLNGRMSIDFGTFSEVNFASNGLIRIKKNGKFGFTDRKLNTIIPNKYQHAEDFKDSVAIVTSKKGHHLINTKGEELFTCDSEIKRVSHDLFLIEKEEKEVLIDKKGNVQLSNIKSYEIYKKWLIVYLENNQIKIISI